MESKQPLKRKYVQVKSLLEFVPSKYHKHFFRAKVLHNFIPSKYHTHWFQTKILDNNINLHLSTESKTYRVENTSSVAASITTQQYEAFKLLYHRCPSDLSYQSYRYSHNNIQLWANNAASIMSNWFSIQKSDMIIHIVRVEDRDSSTPVWSSLVEMPKWGRVLVIFEYGGPTSSVLFPHLNIQWDAICVLRHDPEECAYFIPTGNQSMKWLQLPILHESNLTVFALANIGRNPWASINDDILTHFADGFDKYVLMEQPQQQ